GGAGGGLWLWALRRQRGGGGGGLQPMEVPPAGGLAMGRRPGRRLGRAEARQRLPGDAARREKAGAERVDHGERDEGRERAPFLPAMEAAQVVGAHDPDESDARAALP